jgi:hypothetical protein
LQRSYGFEQPGIAVAKLPPLPDFFPRRMPKFDP